MGRGFRPQATHSVKKKNKKKQKKKTSSPPPRGFYKFFTIFVNWDRSIRIFFLVLFFFFFFLNEMGPMDVRPQGFLVKSSYALTCEYDLSPGHGRPR